MDSYKKYIAVLPFVRFLRTFFFQKQIRGDLVNTFSKNAIKARYDENYKENFSVFMKWDRVRDLT